MVNVRCHNKAKDRFGGIVLDTVWSGSFLGFDFV